MPFPTLESGPSATHSPDSTFHEEDEESRHCESGSETVDSQSAEKKPHLISEPEISNSLMNLSELEQSLAKIIQDSGPADKTPVPAARVVPVAKITINSQHSDPEYEWQQALLRTCQETENFKMLTEQKVEKLQAEERIVKARMQFLDETYYRECKYRDAALSLSKLHKSNKKAEKHALQEQVQIHQKVANALYDLWCSSGRLGEIRQQLLRHNTAVMREGVRKLETKVKSLQSARTQQRHSMMTNNLFIQSSAGVQKMNETLITDLLKEIEERDKQIATSKQHSNEESQKVRALNARLEQAEAVLNNLEFGELTTENKDVVDRVALIHKTMANYQSRIVNLESELLKYKMLSASDEVESVDGDAANPIIVESQPTPEPHKIKKTFSVDFLTMSKQQVSDGHIEEHTPYTRSMLVEKETECQLLSERLREVAEERRVMEMTSSEVTGALEELSHQLVTNSHGYTPTVIANRLTELISSLKPGKEADSVVDAEVVTDLKLLSGKSSVKKRTLQIPPLTKINTDFSGIEENRRKGRAHSEAALSIKPANYKKRATFISQGDVSRPPTSPPSMPPPPLPGKTDEETKPISQMFLDPTKDSLSPRSPSNSKNRWTRMLATLGGK